MDNSNIIKLNIIQWNAQSVRPKSLALEQLLSQDKIHIAALSETWLEPESNFKINNYKIFRKDRQDSYGGVALLIHRSVEASLHSFSSSNPGMEVLMVKIHNCQFIEYVFSIYCAPSVHTDQLDWEHLFSSVDKKALILGDLNAHHTNWSYKTDTRGSQIHDALLESNFVILNDVTSYTRVKLVNNVLQTSSPDITLATHDIAIRLNWATTNENLGSDHLIIRVSTHLDRNIDYITLRRNFKKADWSAYRIFLENLFDSFLMCEGDPQKSYDTFISYINIAADRFIPYYKINRNPSNQFTPKPYWNIALSKCVAERRLALSKFRRNPNPNNLTELQDKIRISQKLIRQARDKSWQEFCSTLDCKITQSQMWRKLRWLKGYNVPRAYIDKEKANDLLCSLTPDYACPNDPVFAINKTNLDLLITRQELDNCIRRKDTSPGSDGISYSMIYNLPNNAKNILLKLYNEFYTLSFVPKQWQDITIVPIPKPNRNPQAPGSLRPIAMISCVCKTFHNILNKRLEWYIEKNNLLSCKTTGFRKHRSTLDNLTNLVSTIQTGFSHNQMCIAVFIDIDNAYNNVDIKSLVNIMQHLGVSSLICRYLWNFLKERCLRMQVDSVSSCRYTCRGLAQGDPLSPLLFNLATIEICNSINNVRISQYADDFTIYLNCDTKREGTMQIQEAINKFVTLLFKIGLYVSSTKSKICVFKRGFRREFVDISINGINLEVVDNVKYLGLWLDRSLRWAKHINELRAKSLRLLNVFKIVAGAGWGMHPIVLRRVYIAEIGRAHV